MKDEFLLLHKNKNHNNIYESYKSLNVRNVIFYADSENSARINPFLGRERIKAAEQEKNPKINTAKQNYCAIEFLIPMDIFNKMIR